MMEALPCSYPYRHLKMFYFIDKKNTHHYRFPRPADLEAAQPVSYEYCLTA